MFGGSRTRKDIVTFVHQRVLPLGDLICDGAKFLGQLSPFLILNGWDPLSKFYLVGVSKIFEDLHKSTDEFIKEYLEIQDEDDECEEVSGDVYFKDEVS